MAPPRSSRRPNGRRVAQMAMALGIIVGGVGLGTPSPTPPASASPRATSSATAGTTPRLAGATPRVPDAVPGELIVRFRPGTTMATRAAVLDDHTARAMLPADGSGPTVVVEVPPGHESEAIDQLEATPAVESAEVNSYLDLLTAPAAPVAAGAAGAAGAADGEVIPWGVARLGAPEVWPAVGDPGAGAGAGAGVRVAVIDSGVDSTHPDLVGRVAVGRDMATGTATTSDLCNHGTGVAGVIAANRDGAGIVGVAPEATIVPIRVTPAPPPGNQPDCRVPLSLAADAITWAIDPAGGDADILNLSFGTNLPSPAIAAAVRSAIDRDIPVVAAAGNAGTSAPLYPAALAGVISVGSVRQTSPTTVTRSSFSNNGKVDVAAPGSQIPLLQVGGGVANGSGTSFAAPHIAGALALLMSAHAEPTSIDAASGAIQRLLGTATDLAPAGIDLDTGHGLPDLPRATRSGADPSDPDLVTVSPDPRWVAGNGGAPDGASTIDLTTVTTGATGATGPTGGATGRTTTTFRSTSEGRTFIAAPTASGQTLPVEVRVTPADDEIPGLSAQPEVSGTVDDAVDLDDVTSVDLVPGDVLTVELTATSGEVTVALFGPDARRVLWDPQLDSASTTSATTVQLTVATAGRHAIDVYGNGTYVLRTSVRPARPIDLATPSPAFVSPDGDGRNDTTTIAWTARRSGTVDIVVFDGVGTEVVRHSAGSVEAGRGTWVWDGRDAAGALVPDGAYAVRLSWSSGSLLRAGSVAALAIDRAAPRADRITDAADPFFPQRDGYRDLSTIRYRLSEPSRVSIEITLRGTSIPVRTLRPAPAMQPVGSRSTTWDGRRDDGSPAPAGRYEYRLVLEDRAGNRSTTGALPVTLRR